MAASELSNVERIAIEMFNAYNAEGPNPWKTFDGRPVPTWEQLNDQVRGKWLAAARESITQLKNKLPPSVVLLIEQTVEGKWDDEDNLSNTGVPLQMATFTCRNCKCEKESAKDSGPCKCSNCTDYMF